jgi:hypothetical protein
MEKCRPPPKSTYKPPKEPIEFKKIREDNHRQGAKKPNHIRSTSSAERKQTKTIEENERNLHFDRFRANPPPKSQVSFFI